MSAITKRLASAKAVLEAGSKHQSKQPVALQPFMQAETDSYIVIMLHVVRNVKSMHFGLSHV